jgi:malonyl CoA-acyl carrier protein transacylase
MKTFLFPGQGSQARGMGGALFEAFPQHVAVADTILGYSVRELCLADPRSELNQTLFTQPALFVVNALSYWKEIASGAAAPDYLAGHSLGELNALLAAGCFDFETGLRIVHRRAQLMSEATGGAMAAVLNSSREEIDAILKDNGLSSIDIANYNSPAQIVISGPREEIARAEPLFRRGRIRFYPLNTSGAFHSRYMQPASGQFRAFLETVAFKTPGIPVISNVTALPYRGGEIADNLANQIVSTVRWAESIHYLLGQAAEQGKGEMQFLEIGHGNVLTRMLGAIKQEAAIPASQAAPRSGAAAVPAGEKVAAWNRSYPVGTRARSTADSREILETRTAALVLFGHRAAVYMTGYNGYFDLDELVPLAAE